MSILALAPMEDVTDVVFRQIVAECAPPDLFFTEFTNVDGMLSKGAKAVMHRLRMFSPPPLLYSSAPPHLPIPSSPPLIAQLWGTNPENFAQAAQIVADMGFDGIDVNMGCPIPALVKKGACSALIGNYEQVKLIIDAIHRGAPNLPVSIKTRLGVKTIQTDEWIGFLLKQELDAVIIHARTVTEMSDVPAHWDEIRKAVQLRDSLGSKTVIIGNGDVMSKAEAIEKCSQYRCDGVMIGRGIFHNLYLFGGEKEFKTFSKEDKIAHLIRHISLFDETWGSTKNFATMKKFYKIYISDFDGASDLRVKLMEFTNAKDTLHFLSLIPRKLP